MTGREKERLAPFLLLHCLAVFVIESASFHKLYMKVSDPVSKLYMKVSDPVSKLYMKVSDQSASCT